MNSPIRRPDGDWWNEPVNRRESIWLGLGAAWSLFLFSWMSGWTRLGDQNPVGETYSVPADEYREKVQQYKEEATDTDRGLVPPGDDVFVGGARYRWDGLPVVLETGREYDVHLGAYDVQHSVSMRPEQSLSKQINLDIMPGYEWIVPMEFDEPGEYHVICTEFCGEGHRTMHGTFHVED